MKKNVSSIAVAVFSAIVILLCVAGSSNAALIKGDFLNIGDGLLITDGSTNIEWLTPFYTKNHTYNDSTVQGIISSYGFRYATGTEVVNMINSNFNNPTTVYPGDAAGFLSAQSFFNYFGINDYMYCDSFSPKDCPRTQGLTSDLGSYANSHLAFGMIQIQLSTGWLIANNSWPDSFTDWQMGSWLVRAKSTPVPESSTLFLLGSGIMGMVIWRKRLGHIEN